MHCECRVLVKDACSKVKDFNIAYSLGYRLGCGGEVVEDTEYGHDCKLCCYERKEEVNKGLFTVWCGGYGIEAKDIKDRKCDEWLNRFGRNFPESAGVLLFMLDVMGEALEGHDHVSWQSPSMST